MPFVVAGIFCQNSHPFATPAADASEKDGFAFAGAEFVGAPDGEAEDGIADLAGCDVKEAFHFDSLREEELGEAAPDGPASGDDDSVCVHFLQAGQIAGLGGIHLCFGIVLVAAGEPGGGIAPLEEGLGGLEEAGAVCQHAEPEIVVLGTVFHAIAARLKVAFSGHEDPGLDDGRLHKALACKVGRHFQGVGPGHEAVEAIAEGILGSDVAGDKVGVLLLQDLMLVKETLRMREVVGVHAGDERGARGLASFLDGLGDSARCRGVKELDAGVFRGEGLRNGLGVVAAAVEDEEYFFRWKSLLAHGVHGFGQGFGRVPHGDDHRYGILGAHSPKLRAVAWPASSQRMRKGRQQTSQS